MAKYDSNNVKENSDFLDFIKQEYGYDSIEAIPNFEYNALLYKFKVQENDFEDEDFAALEPYKKSDKRQEIVDIYYPQKSVEDLSMEDLAFVQAIVREMELNPDVSLDMVRESRRQRKQKEAEKHYSKEDLDGIIKAHNVNILAPDEVQNHELLSELNPNFKNLHTEMFVKTVETAEQDIEAYANGSLTIDDNAYESMEEYISTFGRSSRRDENNEYIYTPVALKALERLKADKEKVAQKEKDAQVKENAENIVVNENADEKNNEQGKTYVLNVIEQENVSENTKKEKTSENMEKSSENAVKAQDARIRSDHNLSNEQKLAAVSLRAMRDMDVISQEDFKKYVDDVHGEDIQKAQEAFDFVDKSEEKIKDQNKYKNTVVDLLLTEDMAELMTPELTTVAYDNLKGRIKAAEKQAKKENTPEADQRVSDLNKQLDNVLAQMDSLQSDFKNKRGYFLLDITNAADAYDGYMHMFDVRQKDLDDKNKALNKDKKELDPQTDQQRITEIDNEISANESLKNEYGQSEQDMDEIIATYDEKWNIPSGKNPKSTAIAFNDRVKTGSKILNQIKFDEETLGAELLTQVSQFKFNDKQGKPIPQFIDPQNPNVKSDVWRKGLEVNPEGELATVLKLAGNDALMENLGSKEKITKESMVEQLKDNVPFKLFEMYNSEETIRGAVEDPEKFTKKKDQYLAEFEAKLNNPEVPLSISPEGYNAAIDDQVNKVEVYTNRLDRKLGKDNNEFTKSVLFDQIQNIDRNAPNRGRSSKDIKKGALKRSLWGIAAGGTLAYVGSRLITNAVATGGVSVIGSSALALGAAVTVGAASTALQIWSRKRAAKKRGEKYGWKEFKKDKMLHASIATTTLACASAAFALANAPELSIPAAACAIGSFGMGAGLRFAQPYRELRLKGHNKTTAFALGALNAAAVFAGGYLGRQHGLQDITPNSHQEIVDYKTVKVGETKTYTDDQIAKVTQRNNSNTMWEYRGEGPHDIPAYRNSANYSNEAWWTPEQHDKAIAALKEQMPKLGWKEGVGNEEVMLRKLASFERLHRNSDFVLPDGKTVGEKFGDYKALLDGLLEGKLTPEGAKQLDVIQYNVGENGHSKILDSLGSELYSYQDHPHGIQTEDVLETKPVLDTVQDEVKAPGGGVFGWVVSSWNKLKNKIRPGTKADQVVKQEQPKTDTPVITPDEPEKPKDETSVVIPVEKEKEKDNGNDKLLLDEYKIVYGIEPDMTPGKDKAWKDYCNRVEEERQKGAPDKDMHTFLLDRRQKLDDAILNTVVSENDVTESGKPIRSDYMAKKAKDDRGKAGVVMEARQSLMQSNLTKDNYTNKITLSHFTKYIDHFVRHDEVVADGSRNIELNPKLKDKYKKEKSKVSIVDLNQYLVEDKPLETTKQKVSGKDARQAMTDLKKTYERD